MLVFHQFEQFANLVKSETHDDNSPHWMALQLKTTVGKLKPKWFQLS